MTAQLICCSPGNEALRQPLHHTANQTVPLHQFNQQLDVDRPGFRRSGPRSRGSAGEIRGEVQAGKRG